MNSLSNKSKMSLKFILLMACLKGLIIFLLFTPTKKDMMAVLHVQNLKCLSVLLKTTYRNEEEMMH